MIEKRFLQETSKGDVYSYILDNGKGLKAEILNLGGIIRRLIFDGVDVVLGRDDYQKYLYANGYFGTIIGRNANKIEDCMFEINGKEYKLSPNDSGIRKFAVLEGDTTGIKMEAFTDMPSVQFHTGNWIDDAPDGKDGAVYGKYQGLCLETQVFPNFTRYSHFPDGYLKKGEKYDSVTEYRFSKIKE